MLSLHERAGEVFLAALSKPVAERDAFVADVCTGDEALLNEVRSLLLFHEGGTITDVDPFAARPDFSAGEVFADRYRMIARVGRGGMGDVWRADDLVLGTPVALKLIHAAGASDRARILQEVRLARQITHPAVCRVFDVGEAGETIFFSMEFVAGEDLAGLLKRTGRLASERVVEIAQQLCGGLAAAHAEGVLHRDLKPANILVDRDGRVRITDFGIALTTSDRAPRAIVGTLGYMAPEQLSADTPISARTDIYALGVVLFELVTGQPFHTISSEDPAVRLSRLASGINPQLARAILKATARDPKDRPASALEMAEALRISNSSRRGVPMWVAGAAVVAALIATAVFVWRPRQPGGALTARDTIILADFTNTTGDPVFDSTLKVALAVALEQSPFLKVFPDDRAHQELPLMQRSRNEAITPAIARDIAQREQLKALIAGSIASLGQHYVVALEAVNAQDGDVMAREQVEVNSKEEVLSSLGSAVSRLRGKLGESLASIQRYDVPLPQATTPSLDALQAYARALDGGRVNDQRVETIPRLKRAIELDPNFALAHAELSGTYANTWQSLLAPPWSRKAFALRDRVSERERYVISWRYYRDATQGWDEGLELAQSWAAAYPRESTAFNSIGLAAWSLGQYQQAIPALQESIRLDEKFFAPRLNLVWTFSALNRFDEARKVIADAQAANIDHIGFQQMSYVLGFLDNDAASMTKALDTAQARPEGFWASNWQPRTAAYGGRMRDAHEGFRRSIAMTTQANVTELSGVFAAQDAISHAIVGQCAEAAKEATAAIDMSRDNFTLESAGRALAWCGSSAAAEDVSRDLTRRFPEAILTTHVIVPVIAAETAIRSKQPMRALELLEPVRRFDHATVSEFWPAYLRGEALRELGRHAEAADEYRSVVDHRGEMIDAPLYPLAHLGLGRALASAGDRAGARKAYDAFLEFWKDADADLQPLKDARRERAGLTQ